MPSTIAKPTLRVDSKRSEAILVLAGDWKIGAVRPALPPELGSGIRSLAFDSSGIGEWDSGLLTFLLDASDFCDEKEIAFDPEGIPDNAKRLLALATAVPEKRDASHTPAPPTVVDEIGQATINAGRDLGKIVDFAGQCSMGAADLIRRRSRLRWRVFFEVVEECGPKALPIVALISLLVGVIIAFLGASMLRQIAADSYVSYIVGFGIMRELGALMTGIIMAGRTGAAFAAEIGSMKVSEEIDALRTFGISPMEYLVMPRVLAMILVMPLLTAFADVIGLFGGYLIADGMLGIPSKQFFGSLVDILGTADVVVGLVKGLIFGVIIAFSGCLRGMQCGTGAGAVGVAATSAVVTGITLIIVANAVIDWITIVYNI